VLKTIKISSGAVGGCDGGSGGGVGYCDVRMGGIDGCACSVSARVLN